MALRSNRGQRLARRRHAPSSSSPNVSNKMKHLLWTASSAIVLCFLLYRNNSTTSVWLPPAHSPLRVFGPSGTPGTSYTYSKAEQELYLREYGSQCFVSADSNVLLERYSLLSEEPRLQQEIWKWCFLYLGHGNLYLDPTVKFVQGIDMAQVLDRNTAVQLDDEKVHGSLIHIQDIKSPVALQMMKRLLESTAPTMEVVQQWLYQSLQNNEEWTLWRSSCLDEAAAKLPTVVLQTEQKLDLKQRILATQKFGTYSKPSYSSTIIKRNDHAKGTCPLLHGYCCQVFDETGNPLALLKHEVAPDLVSHHPFSLGDDDPYVSKVQVSYTGLSPQPLPSFFDLLLHNDCLDSTSKCHKCLKSTKATGGTCKACLDSCPCYCKALCHIRPEPKPITKLYHVYPPKYRKDASRLIPKIVHQTWWEDITQEKYPNMSRLIESWKASGWQYNFYTDDMAGDFLSKHFPPEVREAYEAINPGAFKADLFRYCVLLIQGGVYADMDVMLEANLDEAIAPDVGFMTPTDEPGIKVGRRSCLWNGFLAVAPGHVFLAKTIEMVVNNIRNRFTSVDYDDMLCPNPALSVTHTVDTLFTCGPCILGAGINSILQRGLQDEFEVGDVDLFRATQGKVFHRDDPRLLIPGRTIILQQDKQDMGAHRFTWVEKSMIVAATDMPDYDDRPPTTKHYSDTHLKVGVYGLKKLYNGTQRANEEIQIVVEK